MLTCWHRQPTGCLVRSGQAGVTLLEVLVTIVILAFGLLGLAGFQLKTQSTELESYQRAQALVLLGDMVERIRANQANASAYVTNAALGSDDNQPASCTDLGAVESDQCEWSNALKGASERLDEKNVGAMIGAVGCVEQIQVENTAPGICTPATYRVTVAWQGLSPTVAPNLDCGQDRFTDQTLRRVVSSSVTVAIPACI